MRLFVALEPSAGGIAELDAAVAPLRVRWPELRWVGPDRWHVTLAFLGEVAEDRLDDLCVRLERAAARHGVQTLRIGRGGAFPSVGKARVLISHIEPPEPEPSRPGLTGLTGVAGLAASVSAGARRAGAPPPDEGRRYRPHLTLARSRQPCDLGELVRALGAFAGQPWIATRVHLISSHTGPAPRYDTLGTWPLKTGLRR